MHDTPNVLNRLIGFLETIPQGPITDTTELEPLLAACWPELHGDHSGMEGRKLLGRMEDVAWNPPLLSFTIERHGGTVQGSTRAELQRWTVDVDHGTATCKSGGLRQLHRRQPSLDVDAVAVEIAALIVDRQQDDRLRWDGDGLVRVLIGKVIPSGSAVKQTLEGRRRRLRAALQVILAAKGWKNSGVNPVGAWTFIAPCTPS